MHSGAGFLKHGHHVPHHAGYPVGHLHEAAGLLIIFFVRKRRVLARR
jgi:hypothetical protein